MIVNPNEWKIKLLLMYMHPNEPSFKKSEPIIKYLCLKIPIKEVVNQPEMSAEARMVNMDAGNC